MTRPSLRILRDTDGTVRWEGDYQGAKIVSALSINGGCKYVILLDPVASSAPTFQNLVCVQPDGTTIWKAELPKNHDAFASVEQTADGLYANSWAGYRMKIDIATGKLLESTFVK